MKRIEHCAAHHQIEWDLRQQAEPQQPQTIFFEIRRMKIPLRRLKGENRKGQPAHTGHPDIAGDHRGPHVVQQHKAQGQPPQRRGVQTQTPFALTAHGAASFEIKSEYILSQEDGTDKTGLGLKISLPLHRKRNIINHKENAQGGNYK